MSLIDLRNSDYAKTLAAEAQQREEARRMAIHSRPQGQERWYLTRIGGRSDNEAIKKLTRSDIDHYQPMLATLVPINRNKLSKKQRDSVFRPHMPKLVPLFGKYLFVRFDIRRGDWGDIFADAGMWGIQGIESAGRPLPAPIDDAIIEAIRDREVNGAIPGSMPVRQFLYEIGEVVRVVDPHSAWFGQEMPIEELVPHELLSKKELAAIDGDDGVRLAWSLFGRPTQVLLPLSAISKR